MATNYSYNRTPAEGSSIGGISAVNPQAKGNYQGYIDSAYNAAKSRLDPIFDQQNKAYQQSMTNRGIPVGGEAYNSSFQQMGQNQNDAYTQAANAAIGVGLGAQAQDFGQDATRSQLANALLQSKWSADLGWGNNALGYAGLGEQGRQFDNSMTQRGYEFDQGLGQRQYEFDSTQDYNYWDKGNSWDFAWDRAGNDDYRWAAGQDRQDYYDERSAGQYDDQLLLTLLGINQPASPYYQDPTGGYNAQLGSFNSQYGSNMDFWSKGLWGL